MSRLDWMVAVLLAGGGAGIGAWAAGIGPFATKPAPVSAEAPSDAPPVAEPVVVVGGGPAGLMAAEALSAAGVPVHLYDAMPSVGRKFLLAGRGGLAPAARTRYAPFLRVRRGQLARPRAGRASPSRPLPRWGEDADADLREERRVDPLR